jgi:uncharacterized beta-barrel protein YwiB (DUF1934 family)
MIDFKLTALNENVKFTTEGKQDGNNIEFTAPNGESHFLSFDDKTLVYKKIGEGKINFSFIEGSNTSGSYFIMNNSIQFSTKTKTLMIKDNQILLSYEIFQKNDFINKIDISINYHPIEEEK